MVSGLIELEGTTYVDLMEGAYSAGRVDETICGTWPSVQIDMGLAKEEDFTPEELVLPKPEWATESFDQREAKPTAQELGLPTKQPNNELSIVFGDGRLPFKKKKAAEESKGFGSSQAKASKKKKKKKR